VPGATDDGIGAISAAGAAGGSETGHLNGVGVGCVGMMAVDGWVEACSGTPSPRLFL
jgi:hypothetical protein